MSYYLTPSRVLSFPSFRFPSFWDDEDELVQSGNATGLSISEDDQKVYVEAHLPGIDPKDTEVTYHDGYVWIKGESTEKEEDKARKYYRRASSSFSYRVAVPSDVDQNSEPEAKYKNGILNIAFTKAPESQPKKIQVKLEAGK
ncbi:MAG TPA: Hsp20/alpha crystallin family protein [Patescibacteria group bacterium]|nr:Hsp20/alpha crystallin family protein [Patescibacteria group bacterium]